MGFGERVKASSPWSWIAIGILLTSVGGGAALFLIYSHYFPYLSGARDDWNVFGALLGGFGSCFGAGATLATLLFLAHQNRKQQGFIEWQIKAQTFEQLLSHQRVFSERLEEIESRYDHKIRFPDVESLYIRLFPKNCPSKVDFHSDPEYSETHENLLGRLKARFERLDTLLDKAEWTVSEAYDLFETLCDLVDDLGFKWTGEPSDGDVVRGVIHTGINIYSLHDSLLRLKIIYNSFLRFTGNSEFEGLNRGVTSFVREALMKNRRVRRFVVYNSVPGLCALQDLYFEIKSLRDDATHWLLPDTLERLRETFESREDVAELNDAQNYTNILGTGVREVKDALLKYDESDERYERLNACKDTLHAIFAEIRQT
ncbi:hypothetical protein [Pseudomonas sp. GW531-R1]|uniref:hypothetical protein n=1 Tax=Pseudomonas sp. GW531-R1 TaxID=2075556 RepID=UPI000CCFF172|nr:hypothetical protein [Pseudomonas sp. GW531-R1]POA61136.1 hypothetical protein C1885_05975 [Pseudomonas sp. GW531-R1]